MKRCVLSSTEKMNVLLQITSKCYPLSNISTINIVYKLVVQDLQGQLTKSTTFQDQNVTEGTYNIRTYSCLISNE